MIQQFSKEIYDAIDYFKRNVSKVAYVSGALEMEDKESWKKGYYFKNGEINNLFKAFLWGEGYGYNRRREDEECEASNDTRFHDLVRKMREAQQNYFRTRHKGYLDQSRSLEKQVDAELSSDTPKLF